MKEVTLNGHKVVLYDSIDTMPIVRYHKHNKLMLIDAGIGSTIADFDTHLTKIAIYLRDKKQSEAQTEIENIRQNVYFMQNGIDPRYMSFAVLVKSIDGKEMDDISDDHLKKVCEMLSGAPYKDVADLHESVKKKIDEELSVYFPGAMDDAVTKEHYDNLKRRTLCVLEGIINGETPELEERIEELTKLLYYSVKPKRFAGEGNAEVEYD